MTKTQSRTQDGKYKEIRMKLQGNGTLAKLQGFNCLHHDFKNDWIDMDEGDSKNNEEQ